MDDRTNNIGDLTDENIEVRYDFWRVFTTKMA